MCRRGARGKRAEVPPTEDANYVGGSEWAIADAMRTGGSHEPPVALEVYR